MTAPTALRLAAGTVLATVTGIATNLATAEHARPWMWVVVVVATVLSIGVAIWAGMGREQPPGAGARTTADRDTSRGPTVNVIGSVVGGNVTGGDARFGPPSGAVLGLMVLAAGLGFGLAHVIDRGSDTTPTPPVVTPAPITPTASAEPTRAPGTATPTPGPRTPVAPRSTPRRTPVAPPVAVPGQPPAAESPAGTWLSIDRTFETLHLNSDGTYRWEDPPRADRTGHYQVQGSQLILTSGAGEPQTFRWTLGNELLTLNDGSGTERTYTRN